MVELEEGYIGNKYFVDTKPIETGKNIWNILEVTVSRLINGQKEIVGSYTRNYPSFYDTFFPFVLNGRELALYSNHYMYTRVMELPSCKDLGGEDKTNVEYRDHFCPVEFYVPVYRLVSYPEFEGKVIKGFLTGDECFDKQYDNGKNMLGPVQYCNFGFVAGCFWGEDQSWKIRFLDLSSANRGAIKKDRRLGFAELPSNLTLKDAIDMRSWLPDHPMIGFTHTSCINYETKEIGN